METSNVINLLDNIEENLALITVSISQNLKTKNVFNIPIKTEYESIQVEKNLYFDQSEFDHISINQKQFMTVLEK